MNSEAALAMVRLSPLMALSAGERNVIIGLIDGPVVNVADLTPSVLHRIGANRAEGCSNPGSPACQHGTYIAGSLIGHRESGALGVCPACTVLARPVFTDGGASSRVLPIATPAELAESLVECLNAGARIINLSLQLSSTSGREERKLLEALDQAVVQSAIVVAAAGNQTAVGSSVLTRHPVVIPVVACNERGAPMSFSTLGASIGRRGFRAPGSEIVGLGTTERLVTPSGSSVAVPFVSGTIALLWSLHPNASARDVRAALNNASPGRRNSVVPSMLNAWGAHVHLANTRREAA